VKPKSFMLIAGEASGDLLAAELVGALREKVLAGLMDTSADAQPLRTALAPRFFGAGGPRMAGAGVELAFDLTQHSVIGLAEVLKEYPKFRRLFRQLIQLAIERQPDVIIGVDYSGFNLRFGRAIMRFVRANRGQFSNWDPKIVQFVSPQVWASRPGRAQQLAENYDLLLSIFPFEKDWYARRVPKLRVECVGHPMVGRIANAECGVRSAEQNGADVLLLPGSRVDEVRRHLPVIWGSVHAMVASRAIDGAIRFKMILPSQEMADEAGEFDWPENTQIQVGNIFSALAEADLAITKSGTITMECAMFGVPAVVFYKTSWPTYLIAKQMLSVRHIAMPNLLAAEEIFPEFIQTAATPENIARAALELLRNDARRQAVKSKLALVVASLGGPGATGRAADAVVGLLA
jgi:lipid-A-disaccharide synthase